MNSRLTTEIAIHVLSNLGIIESNFVNYQRTKSLIDPNFLLPEKVSFTLDNQQIHNHVYGSQVNLGGKDIKLLLADCSQEKDFPEYALLVQLKDAPAFGVYLINNSQEALIGVNTDKKFWMPCTTYLEGTFLAAMEQLRDLGTGWTKCSNYQSQYQQLLSFIEFHDNLFGENNEG